MDSGGGGSGPGTKKSLQEMSREELVQKCKTLLAIAHKAKVAKDGKFAWLSDCFWFFLFTFFFWIAFVFDDRFTFIFDGSGFSVLVKCYH